MYGTYPCQSFSGGFFELPDMVCMTAPRHENEAEQEQNKVILIIADIVEYERSTLAEQIPPQRKGNSPDESTGQVDQEKCAGGKIGYAENYGQKNSESIDK